MVRDHGHVLALEQAAMTAASPAAPHRRKQRIPPGPAALAAAHSPAHGGRQDPPQARRPGRPSTSPATPPPHAAATPSPPDHATALQDRESPMPPAKATAAPDPGAGHDRPGQPLPATAQPPRRAEAARRRRSAPRRPGRRGRRGPTPTAALERLFATEVTATEARRLPAGSASPPCPPPPPWTTSTMRRPAAVDPKLIAELATCAISKTPPTSCSSARPAWARPCSPSASARKAADAGTASTSPPPPSSPPAATAPPSKAAGPPPCASTLGPGSW